MQVSDLVRDEVARRFPSSEVGTVLARLAATRLPFLDAPDRARERARVHLAILKWSDGSFRQFEIALRTATTDWRDILMAADMGEANWPEVLRAAGYPVP